MLMLSRSLASLLAWSLVSLASCTFPGYRLRDDGSAGGAGQLREAVLTVPPAGTLEARVARPSREA